MTTFKYSVTDTYTKQTTIFDTLGQAKQFIANSVGNREVNFQRRYKKRSPENIWTGCVEYLYYST